MIKKIGIIGAGQMGAGIAQVCALSGLEVIITDVGEIELQRALQSINNGFDRQISRGKLSVEEKEAAIRHITCVSDTSSLSEANLVIEAVSEQEEVKRGIFKNLIPTLNKDCIIASNTSSISITRLAASTDRPERFIGISYFLKKIMTSFISLCVSHDFSISPSFFSPIPGIFNNCFEFFSIISKIKGRGLKALAITLPDVKFFSSDKSF